MTQSSGLGHVECMMILLQMPLCCRDVERTESVGSLLSGRRECAKRGAPVDDIPEPLQQPGAPDV